MRDAERILLIIGGSFFLLGAVMTILFLSLGGYGMEPIFALIPFLFVILGGCMSGCVIYKIRKEKSIRNKGTKYSAKIYGYERDTSVLINGEYPTDTKVRFFDEHGKEREVLLHTQTTGGARNFPVGMTIDIFEFEGKYTYDPKSIRSEVLPRENELMDVKPIEPEKLEITAITCKKCGATYEAAVGYSNRCPYCGSYTNV